MNKLRQCLAVASVAIGCLGPQQAAAQNYQLVWQDEFNGGISPDWIFETGNGSDGWGNQEFQYYRRENTRVENGALVITAKRENVDGFRYTSSRMKTQGKRSFTYGKIEARIDVPYGQGLWPAFWTLGESISQIGWPACGEIDVMEHINSDNSTFGTIHWSDQNGNYATYSGDRAGNVRGYHVYTIEWTDQFIKWFVDGELFHEADIAGGKNGTEEFHKPQFLLLNLAVGGRFPGFEVDDSRLPAQLRVDYVRVYQKGGTPPPPPPPPSGDAVSLYLDCSFGGGGAGIGEGRYDLNDLAGRGIPNDKLSSLRVKAGYEVELFWDSEFRGRTLVVRSDDSCLDNEGWNDRASSLIVRRSGGGGGASQQIEAERFTDMKGIQVEPCSEGGENVGYVDQGDWLYYANIPFPTSGRYRIEYRVASPNGSVLSSDLNSSSTVLGNVNIPATGGWQNWTTVSQTVNVSAGTYSFGVYAQQAGWNINWIKITPLGSNALAARTNPDDVRGAVYPNPANNQLNLPEGSWNTGTEISIADVSGRQIVGRAPATSERIDVSNLPAGMFVLTLHQGGSEVKYKFVKE